MGALRGLQLFHGSHLRCHLPVPWTGARVRGTLAGTGRKMEGRLRAGAQGPPRCVTGAGPLRGFVPATMAPGSEIRSISISLAFPLAPLRGPAARLRPSRPRSPPRCRRRFAGVPYCLFQLRQYRTCMTLTSIVSLFHAYRVNSLQFRKRCGRTTSTSSRSGGRGSVQMLVEIRGRTPGDDDLKRGRRCLRALWEQREAGA